MKYLKLTLGILLLAITINIIIALYTDDTPTGETVYSLYVSVSVEIFLFTAAATTVYSGLYLIRGFIKETLQP